MQSMKDVNPSREQNSMRTNTEDGSDKEASQDKEAGLPPKGAAPKKRSSGRGLYITAIVLGIIVVLLLALYIFLALTYQKPAHSVVVPTQPAIIQIAKS
jgi:hypothetical protein